MAIAADSLRELPWAIWPGAMQDELRDELAGFKRCDLLATPRVDAKYVTLVVGQPPLERLIDIDALFAARRATWLPIYLDDEALYCGPLLQAGRLCLSCLYRRRLAASYDPFSISSRFSSTYSYLTADYRHFFGRLREELRAIRFPPTEFQMKIPGSSVAVTYHPVLRVPGCPSCCRDAS